MILSDGPFVQRFASASNDEKDGFKCGLSLLLRRALQEFFSNRNNTNGAKVLERFLLASCDHFSMLAHTLFDFFYDENEFEHAKNKYTDGSELSLLILKTAVIVFLFRISQNYASKDEGFDVVNACFFRDHLSELLLQLNGDEVKDAVLFVVRYWSCGGTVEIDKAISICRNQTIYPLPITTHAILEQIHYELQTVSPLMSIPDVASAMGILSDATIQKSHLSRLNDIPTVGVVGSVISILAGVPAREIKGVDHLGTGTSPPHCHSCSKCEGMSRECAK